MTWFERKVFNLVKRIPRGKVITYKALAIKLGNPRLARAVGNALNKNPYLIKVPCHRVIRSDRTPGGYKSGIKKKINLLKEEGVVFHNNKADQQFLDFRR